MSIRFDDCVELVSLPRDELLRSLSLLATGVPLWHPLGFVSCTLASAPDWALKVHLWPKGKRLSKSPNWPIHDHAFRIESRILHGTLRNREYSLTPGTRCELYRVVYENKSSGLVRTRSLTDVKLTKSTVHVTDDSYSIERSEFHNTVVSIDTSAATVVLKTNRGDSFPLVVGRPWAAERLAPLYQRESFPEDVFWRSVFSPLESPHVPIGLKTGELRLSDHTPDWTVAYAHEVLELRRLLADHFITAEHIGSTSIPDIPAKPIVDMMVAVPTMRIAQQMIGRMTEAGYVYRPDGSLPDRVYFNRRSGQVDTHHVSISTTSTNFWAEKCVFRDFLRANRIAKEQYAKLKQTLASSLGNDRVAYTNSKREFVYGVLKQAVHERNGNPEFLVLIAKSMP